MSEQPVVVKEKPFLKEATRLFFTLLAAGIIALIAANFTSSGAESTRRVLATEQEIKVLQKDVVDLKLVLATQQEWNRHVMEMLKELKNENARRK